MSDLRHRLDRLEAAAPSVELNADAIRDRISARLEGMRQRMGPQDPDHAPDPETVRQVIHERLVALGVRPPGVT